MGHERGCHSRRRLRHPADDRAMTPYDAFGGDDFVRKLCARFYGLMDTLPEAAACRAVHPPSLVRAEQKLFEYLTGWLGCFHQAWAELVPPSPLAGDILARIDGLGRHMANRE